MIRICILIVATLSSCLPAPAAAQSSPIVLLVNPKSGLLTALAVAGKQRFPGFPDVPTFAEAGYPELAGVFPGGNPTGKTAYAWN
jgi:tripartite-type tricarboxylate transporter receptor subunit TctC